MGFVLTLLYIILNYISIGETFPVIAPFRIMIILGVIALLVSLVELLQNREVMSLPQFPLMIAFIAMLCFSRLIHGWLGGIAAALVEFLPVAATFFLVSINATSVTRVKTVGIVVGMLALLMVTMGLRQFQSGGGELVFEQRLVDPATGDAQFLQRLMYRGFLNDPNDFAQFLLVCVPLFGLLWKKRNPIFNFFFVFIPWGVLATGIIYTRSRGVLLGVAVLMLLYLKEKIGMAAGAIGSTFALVTLLILGFAGGRAISVGGGMDRLDIWSDGLGMFKGSPIWGVGYGAFTEYSHLTAHNSYLLAVAELGLIGLFLWMGIIVCSVMQLSWIRKTLASRPALAEWSATAKVLQFALYAFLVTSYFLSRTYTTTLYLLIAMIMAMTLQVRMALQYEATQTKEPPPIPLLGNWIRPSVAWSFGLVVSFYVAVRMRVF